MSRVQTGHFSLYIKHHNRLCPAHKRKCGVTLMFEFSIVEYGRQRPRRLKIQVAEIRHSDKRA